MLRRSRHDTKTRRSADESPIAPGPRGLRAHRALPRPALFRRRGRALYRALCPAGSAAAARHRQAAGQARDRIAVSRLSRVAARDRARQAGPGRAGLPAPRAPLDRRAESSLPARRGTGHLAAAGRRLRYQGRRLGQPGAGRRLAARRLHPQRLARAHGAARHRGAEERAAIAGVSGRHPQSPRSGRPLQGRFRADREEIGGAGADGVYRDQQRFPRQGMAAAEETRPAARLPGQARQALSPRVERATVRIGIGRVLSPGTGPRTPAGAGVIRRSPALDHAQPRTVRTRVRPVPVPGPTTRHRMPAPSRTHLVLIPSYNTGDRVLETARAARRHWKPVWVVIDGSTDGSTEKLRAMAASDPGLRVLALPRNQGKGAAILHGLREAAALGFTHALTMDADGQHPADRIPAFMAESARRPEALVLGRPLFDASAPAVRVLGRRVSNWFAHLETLWSGIGDSLYGFRVYPLRA